MAHPLGVAIVARLVIVSEAVTVTPSAVGVGHNCCLLLLAGNAVVGMEQGARGKSADVGTVGQFSMVSPVLAAVRI